MIQYATSDFGLRITKNYMEESHYLCFYYYFLTKTYQELVKLLPARDEPMDIPDGEAEVEECHLTEFFEQRGRSNSAYAESDDEEDGGSRHGGPGGPGMQCATQ